MTEEAGSGKAISRRELLKRGAVGAGGLVVSGAFAEPIWARRRKLRRRGNTIKIGFVSPLTGPAGGFGEAGPVRPRSRAKGLRQGPHGRRDARTPCRSWARTASRARPRRRKVANDLIHSDERRPHARDLDPGDRQPGLRRLRGGRRPVHLARSSRGRRGTSAAARKTRTPSPFRCGVSTSASASRTSPTPTRTCGRRCRPTRWSA